MPILALLALVVATALVWAAIYVLGRRRWSATTADIRSRLRRVQVPLPPGTVDLAGLESLPAPVQRYLRQAVRPGSRVPRHARFRQRGQFNLAADGERWRPFDADQLVQLHRPGFDWNARIHFAAGVPVRVHDAYAGGIGWLRASVFGLVDLASISGGGAIAEGELMRWLAESPWYPTALLPGGGVTWRAIDAHSAEATLADGDVRVSLVFVFSDDGLVRGVRAAERARAVGRRLVPTPWEGRFRRYVELEGMRVPGEAEVGWHLDGAYRPYWRGRTVGAAYDCAG